MQFLALTRPERLDPVPAGQSVGSPDPAGQYAPAGHTYPAHCCSPTSPVRFDHVPAGQSEHVLAPDQAVPAGHNWHAEPDRKRPDGQSRFTARMRWSSASVTYSDTLSRLSASPTGKSKLAALPTPSKYPSLPLPATRLVLP